MTLTPPKSLLRAGLLFLAVALLVVGCIPGARPRKLGPAPDLAFVVPDLTGLTPEEARTVLIRNKLTFGHISYSADSRWGEAFDPGSIVAQTQTAGARVPKGTVVDVVVYKPTVPEYGEVPSVVGLKYADAVKLLKEAAFLPGKISKRHTTDARRYDEVYRQSPEAGSTARRWTKINLGLYGPVEEGFVNVPRLTGLKADEVPTALGKLGLVQGEITFEQAPNASFIGTVRGQSPAIGTLVKQGTKVDIVVYSE